MFLLPQVKFTTSKDSQLQTIKCPDTPTLVLCQPTQSPRPLSGARAGPPVSSWPGHSRRGGSREGAGGGPGLGAPAVCTSARAGLLRDWTRGWQPTRGWAGRWTAAPGDKGGRAAQAVVSPCTFPLPASPARGPKDAGWGGAGPAAGRRVGRPCCWEEVPRGPVARGQPGGWARRALFSAEAAGGEPAGQGTWCTLSTSRVLTRLPQSLKSNAPKIDGRTGRGEWRTRVGAGACPALPSAAAHTGEVSAC